MQCFYGKVLKVVLYEYQVYSHMGISDIMNNVVTNYKVNVQVVTLR